MIENNLDWNKLDKIIYDGIYWDNILQISGKNILQWKDYKFINYYLYFTLKYIISTFFYLQS